MMFKESFPGYAAYALGLLAIFIVLALVACAPASERTVSQINQSPSIDQAVPTYGYKIVNSFPHDVQAFTEGLVYDNGYLYEGTGLKGQSSLRKVDLSSGRVLQKYELATNYFGEGITVYGENIIQLTWKSHLGFVYDKNTFTHIRDFTYTTEGWGLTQDGSRLIMSDGTSRLYFLDPQTFQVTGSIEVQADSIPVDNLNELEYINGKIFANVWETDKIAIINPQNGSVSAWLDLTGLLSPKDYTGPVDVLNGIAYDSPGGRLLVTGKLWPLLFQIALQEGTPQ
jgi:glutamine cyclotransferase